MDDYYEYCEKINSREDVTSMFYYLHVYVTSMYIYVYYNVKESLCVKWFFSILFIYFFFLIILIVNLVFIYLIIVFFFSNQSNKF